MPRPRVLARSAERRVVKAQGVRDTLAVTIPDQSSPTSRAAKIKEQRAQQRARMAWKRAAMSEEEKAQQRAKDSARMAAKRAVMNEAQKRKHNAACAARQRKVRLVARTNVLGVVAKNPERYEAAGAFIKNSLFDIESLHGEIGHLKQQLQQIVSDAVRTAVKRLKGEKRRAEVLGQKCHTEAWRPSVESVELHKHDNTLKKIYRDSSSEEKSENSNTTKNLGCPSCSKKFGTSLGLTIHQKEHLVVLNEFGCSICSEVFHTYNLMTTHYLQVHSHESYEQINESTVENEETDDEFERCLHEIDFLFSRKCFTCFASFDIPSNSLAAFSKHIIDQHSENKYLLKHFTHICARCDKPHSALRFLASHWKTICFKKWKNKAENVEKLVCEHCGSKLSNEKSLSSHLKLNHTVKNVICEKCGSQFKHESGLRRHIVRVHQSEYKFSCENCDRKFKTQKALKVHTKTVHLGEKPFVCKFCSKRFASGSSLECHENTHTGEKPYECKLCGKSYAARSSLISHEGIHDGYKCKICEEICGNYVDLCQHRKLNHPSPNICHGVNIRSDQVSNKHQLPTSCEICGTTVKGFLSLKNHHQTVHGGRKYVCDICGKIYKTPTALTGHTFSHDNLKRFGCSLCGRKFRQTTNFYQHRRVTHANENAQIVKLTSDTDSFCPAEVDRSQLVSNLKSASMTQALSPDQNSNTKQASNEIPDVHDDTPTESTISTFHLEGQVCHRIDDIFSTAEFDDEDNELANTPQFEIAELEVLSSTCLDLENTHLVLECEPNSSHLKETIFEKTFGDSKFIDFSRADVVLEFSTLSNDESGTELMQQKIVSSDKTNEQQKVFIEDSEDFSFITDVSIDDLVKLKSETLGDIGDDDSVISDLFKSDDGISENEAKINREEIHPDGDVRNKYLKPPQIDSSPYLVVKLTKLLEYKCNPCNKTVFALNQRELCQHSGNHKKNIPQNKDKSKLEKKKSKSKERKCASRKSYEKLSVHDCFYCSQTEFETTTSIIEHCTKEHPGKEPLKCKICFKTFNTGKSFLDHKAKVHNYASSASNVNAFLCELCGKKFSSPQYVKVHVLSMHQERKLQCEVCSKLFFKMWELDRHKARHLGVKTHLCEECGKAFITPFELKDHILRVHRKIKRRITKEKSSDMFPFSCHLCPHIMFRRESSLKDHLGLHDPQRKHSCDECGLRFKLYTHLKTHKDYKHKKNESKDIIVTATDNLFVS